MKLTTHGPQAVIWLLSKLLMSSHSTFDYVGWCRGNGVLDDLFRRFKDPETRSLSISDLVNFASGGRHEDDSSEKSNNLKKQATNSTAGGNSNVNVRGDAQGFVLILHPDTLTLLQNKKLCYLP